MDRARYVRQRLRMIRQDNDGRMIMVRLMNPILPILNLLVVLVLMTMLMRPPWSLWLTLLWWKMLGLIWREVHLHITSTCKHLSHLPFGLKDSFSWIPHSKMTRTPLDKRWGHRRQEVLDPKKSIGSEGARGFVSSARNMDYEITPEENSSWYRPKRSLR